MHPIKNGGITIELSHWRGFPAFTIVEATLLSVGRDPRTTNFDSLFETFGRSEQADKLLYYLENRQEQIARAFGLDPDDNVAKIPAPTFFSWSHKLSIEIDHRFRRMLKKCWGDKTDTRIVQPVQVDPDDCIPHGTSRKAYARLVTGIAIQRYSLTKEEEIGRIANRMCDDTKLAGLGVQAKPIRNLLRLGWSLLQPEYRPS